MSLPTGAAPAAELCASLAGLGLCQGSYGEVFPLLLPNRSTHHPASLAAQGLPLPAAATRASRLWNGCHGPAVTYAKASACSRGKQLPACESSVRPSHRAAALQGPGSSGTGALRGCSHGAHTVPQASVQQGRDGAPQVDSGDVLVLQGFVMPFLVRCWMLWASRDIPPEPCAEPSACSPRTPQGRTACPAISRPLTPTAVALPGQR